jgi:hypothetical protein
MDKSISLVKQESKWLGRIRKCFYAKGSNLDYDAASKKKNNHVWENLTLRQNFKNYG